MMERRAHNTQMAEDIAYMRGILEGMVETNKAKHDAIDSRVSSLERTNTRQWWLHGAQVLVMGALGFAKKAGLI